MSEIELFAQVQELLRAGTPFVLVTLVSIKGSAPQDLGAKAIITREGIRQGTVGGGKLEAKAIRHAQQMLEESPEDAKQLCTWNLQRDLGMTCGGEASMFFDGHFVNQWNIALFGAGHVIQALVPILSTMKCQIYCVDPRQDWLDKMPSYPNLKRFCLSDPAESVSVVPEDSFVCLITQGHGTDLPILKELLKQSHRYPYIGMIGSDTKALRVRKALEKDGYTKDQIAELRSPIGLPIGTNHQTEIAISIIAEMLQVRDQTLHPE